jgi:Alpha/beta hydrolase of unknown function (DUF900)/Bacterial TSP3 repeat
MKALPIRLFHAVLPGLAAGALLGVIAAHLTLRLEASPVLDDGIATAEADADATAAAASTTAAATAPPSDDRDHDGMPDAWETRHHHDPDNAADATADFDHDGLNALEEYQLNQRDPSAGSPLGGWSVSEVPLPDDGAVHWPWPVDINNQGELLVTGVIDDGDLQRTTSFLIDADGTWHETRPDAVAPDDWILASDFNDRGEVVGARQSMNEGTSESFVWDRGSGYRRFTFQGVNAGAWRINNAGDWVGWVEDPIDGARPAHVVDGVNLHGSGDWWPQLWFSDINDSGEALGGYVSPETGLSHTILAHGSWRFDTGLLGGMPFFDPDTGSWSWSAAMNGHGEFTGGAAGLSAGEWAYAGYRFDGSFREIRFAGRGATYVSPESINTAGTVVGHAATTADWGAFIHRDGITVFLSEACPQAGQCQYARINEAGEMVTITTGGRMLRVSPAQDEDGDGMADDWEAYHGLDGRNAADASADADADGTNNLGEFLLRSDPRHPPVLDANGTTIDCRAGIDDDGDGMPNLYEWEQKMDWLDPADAAIDFDRDGYSNLQEYRMGTDPRGAPAFRLREIGPFPGAASLQWTPLVLLDQSAAAAVATASVQFAAQPAAPVAGGRRPASWSAGRGETADSFAFHPSHGGSTTQVLAHSASGASIAMATGVPVTFHYWASPVSQPVAMSGAATACDVATLHNAKFSPGGTFLVATRALASKPGTYQAVLWKMPGRDGRITAPMPLTPPAGITMNSFAALHVNDHGCVTSTGWLGSQSRALLWRMNDAGTTVSAIVLPPLTGAAHSETKGISNQARPSIIGTSTATGGRPRAVVWNAAGTATDLVRASISSNAAVISPGGVIAVCSSMQAGTTLQHQVALARFDAATAQWTLQPQGSPSARPATLQAVNDSGEILGQITRDPTRNQPAATLWRHGREHPLAGFVPTASGCHLENVTALNSDGVLLATVWKEGTRVHTLLTPDADTDGDGLPDAFENQHGFNPFEARPAGADADGDGLDDLAEFHHGTHPRSPDSDNDGMRDGWEVSWGMIPLDAADAALDPDHDRVSNLREFQIGTTPTGIHRTEIRWIDETGSSPEVIAANDPGALIRTGESTYLWDDSSEPGYYHESQVQGYHHHGVTPDDLITSLPPFEFAMRASHDFSSYAFRSDTPSYHIDPASGAVHAFIHRSNGRWDGDHTAWEEEAFFVPDVIHASDPETSWIRWDTAVESLRNGTLAADDTLLPHAVAVSDCGTRRLHQSGLGTFILLDERGQWIATLPASVPWSHVNRHGHAVALQSTAIAATTDLPAYQAPVLAIFRDGGTDRLAIPHEPGTSPNFRIHAFADNGKVLLQESRRTTQGAITLRHAMFDPTNGTLTRIATPGMGLESILPMNPGGRLVGSGPEPFVVTPDGASLRIAALRIRSSDPANASTQPFVTCFPGPIQPRHITADGRITVAATDARHHTQLIQLIPDNDADHDGMSDDWEKSEVALLLDAAPARWANLAANADLDADTDYWDDGLTASRMFFLGLSTGQRSLSRTRDSDQDGLADAEDADPTDPSVSWRRTEETSYVIVDLKTPPGENGLPHDLNDHGEALYDHGIATVGGWIPLNEPMDTEGSCKVQNEDASYLVHPVSWHAFTNDRHLLGWSEIRFTSGPLAGGDALISTRFWSPDRSPADLGEGLLQASGFPAPEAHPLGIAEDGRQFIAIHHPAIPGQANRTRQEIRIVSADGTSHATAPLDEDLEALASPRDFGLSRSGWFAANTVRKTADGTTEIAGLRLWNPQLTPVALPDEAANQHFSTVRVHDLPGDALAVVATGGNRNEVFVRKANGTLCHSESLSLSGVELFAGNGTAITGDQQLWRNGRRIPIHRLSESCQQHLPPGSTVTPVDASSDGSFLLRVEYPDGETSDKILLPMEIVADANRDGSITLEDRGKITAENPWRFWVNADDDSKDEDSKDVDLSESSDNPLFQKCDANKEKIQGLRDLVDFFPVHLDLRAALASMPADQFKYRLVHAKPRRIDWSSLVPSPFNVVWLEKFQPEGDPNLPGTAGGWLKSIASAHRVIDCKPIQIPYEGLDIPEEVLTASRNGTGLALIECRGPTERPLMVEIYDNTDVAVAQCSLRLKISPVADMLRHIRLDPDEPVNYLSTAAPPNWPDVDRNRSHIVFLHGYNVTETEATGWGAEMFKRFFWSGYNGLFTSVGWEGDIGRVLGVTPDYQRNLLSAFDSAKSLAYYIQNTGPKTTVVAHSMGNIVASSAIHDWGARPYAYAMLNAAVAKEAYDPSEAKDAEQDARMVHPKWRRFRASLRASEWHRLLGDRGWPQDDARRLLTWKGRFDRVVNTGTTKVYNYFSSGEEVLNNPEITDPNEASPNLSINGMLPWTTANKVWAMQEKRKGLGLTGLIHTSNYGGWQFNGTPRAVKYQELEVDLETGPHMVMKPEEKLGINQQFLLGLQAVPFFDDSEHRILFHPETGRNSPGSRYAAEHRNTIISEMIPCTTFAAGKNAFIYLKDNQCKNENMNDSMKTDPFRWPESSALIDGNEKEEKRPWLHSDLRNKPFTHNWKLFKDLTAIGQ